MSLLTVFMSREKPLISNTEKQPSSPPDGEKAQKARVRLREYVDVILRGEFDFEIAEKRFEEIYDGTSELPQEEQTALLHLGNVLHDLEEDAATRPFVESVRRLSEVKARGEELENQLQKDQTELAELKRALKEKIPPQVFAREIGIPMEEGKGEETIIIDKAWGRFAAREEERRETYYAARRVKDILARFGKEKALESFIRRFRAMHKEELDALPSGIPSDLKDTIDTLNSLKEESDQEQIVTVIMLHFAPSDISLVNSILWEEQREEERGQRESLKKAKRRERVSGEEAAEELTKTLKFYEKFLASPPAAFASELKKRMAEKNEALIGAVSRQKSKLDVSALEKELDLMFLFSIVRDLTPEERVTYGLDTRRLKELLDPLTVSMLEEKLRERIITRETKLRNDLIWNEVKDQWSSLRAGIVVDRYEQEQIIAEILKKYREYKETREEVEQELKELFPALEQTYADDTAAVSEKAAAEEAQLDRSQQRKDLTPPMTYEKMKRRIRKARANQKEKALVAKKEKKLRAKEKKLAKTP